MSLSSVSDVATERILPLSSVRFFAAAYVVLFHWLRMVPIRLHSGFLFRFVSLGGISVNFFFLLSGYILTWVYFRRNTRVDKRKFYVARFARIYPIFVITLIADTAWYFSSYDAQFGLSGGLLKTGITFVRCLVMLQAWSPQFWGMDYPNWSLSVETLFYLIFPFVGVLLWRIRGVWIWVAMVVAYIVGQALVLLAISAAGSDKLALEEVLYFPPLHITTFLLGILLARLQVFNGESNRRILDKRWMVITALGLTVAIYLAIVLLTPDDLSRSYHDSANLRDGLLAPLFCVVIWAVSSAKTNLSRLLSNRWLVLLGESSYGLYLIHVPVLHALLPAIVAMDHFTVHAEFVVVYLFSVVVYLSLCIGLSVASFHWIETPARRWISLRLRNRRGESLDGAVPERVP